MSLSPISAPPTSGEDRPGTTTRRAGHPTAAKGRFPYPHRILAEIASRKVSCGTCGQRRGRPCGSSRCPLLGKVD